jgi:acyl-CoA thioesterase-1
MTYLPVLGAALALWLLPAAALGAAETAPLRILAFGDSLVHGYGLAADESFPTQLERALEREGHRVQVLNGGNSGDTTAAGLARLDWSLADRPDLAIVELGANDGLRGIDPGETYRNLDAIVKRLKAEGIAVLLAGMLAPRNLGADYVEAFDAVFPRLAEVHEVALYPFFLDGVAMRPELNQADGIHPNAAGVALMVERILPSVVRLIDALAERRGIEAADG